MILVSKLPFLFDMLTRTAVNESFEFCSKIIICLNELVKLLANARSEVVHYANSEVLLLRRKVKLSSP